MVKRFWKHYVLTARTVLYIYTAKWVSMDLMDQHVALIKDDQAYFSLPVSNNSTVSTVYLRRQDALPLALVLLWPSELSKLQ